ncbi:Ankyrin-R [Cladobotryum mycophilum]|uniref:Ankyrin-R n=1 Tax=Cladobotryum mycophilum TaxID=491253 RepID=A0ABR0SN99_9HYPO
MPSTWVSAFLIISIFVENASADSGDDFYNNLFSDLAPLLALFGERVTMQFMSQAMGLADCIVLAMAPLGIITAIISAIRVGGPAWLKAIIGRATENLSAAELELMSSTSQEVCELWNGENVVRCQGSAPIWEFICLVPEELDIKSEESEYRVQVTTLKQAENDKLINKELSGWKRIQRLLPMISLHWDTFSLLKIMRWRKNPANDVESSIIQGYFDRLRSNKLFDQSRKKPIVPKISIIGDTDPAAPNLSLNRHNTIERGEIYLLAAFGTILQLGILLYFGFITYYPAIQLDFLKNDQAIATYAAPMAISGTVMVVLGVLLCAHVVESSTTERYYTPGEGHKAYIIWLQQGSTVSDQVFKSFAIHPTEERAIITMSRRAQRNLQGQKNAGYGQPSTGLEIKTLLGTAMGVVGFVIQFVGLRGMHWSASIAQLGGILLMAVLRSWVRRGLANQLGFEELSPKLEIDWLVLQLGKANQAPWFPKSKGNEQEVGNNDSGTWTVAADSQGAHQKLEFVLPEDSSRYEGLDKSSRPSKDISTTAHDILKIRNDLGRLSDWRGETSEVAIRVAKTIETIMEILFPQVSQSKRAFWYLEVNCGKESSQTISFRLDFGTTKAQDGTDTKQAWKAYADEIDSALSLWIYSVRSKQHKLEGQKRDVKNLDKKDDAWLRRKGLRQDLGLRLFPQSCIRDFQFCRPGGLSGMLQAEDLRQGMNDAKDWRIVGCDRKLAALAIQSYDNLEELYAKHILSAFMCSAAKALELPSFGLTVEKNPSYGGGLSERHPFSLQSEEVLKLAKAFEDNGFGGLSEVSLSIIPALSEADQLSYPFPETSDAVDSIADGEERKQEWQKVGDLYLFLLDKAQLRYVNQYSSHLQATLFSLRYLSKLYSEREIRLKEGRDIANIGKVLEELREKLRRTTERHVRTSSLPTHYKFLFIPCEEEILAGMLEQSSPDAVPNRDCRELFKLAELHLQARDSVEIQGDSKDMNAKDICGWTPLHYAAISGHKEIDRLWNDGMDANAQDLRGRTPLHYASWCGHTDFVDCLVKKGATIDVQDRDGASPLHFAALQGHLDVIKLLLDGFEGRPNEAEGGKVDGKAREFWSSTALQSRDYNGRSPIHWAVIKGHAEVVKALRTKTNIKDNHGLTALHLGVLHGKHDALKAVAKGLGADKESTNDQGLAPLHLATKMQNCEAMEILLANGASVDTRDKRDHTPWMVAIEERFTTGAELLRQNGANVNALGEFRWNPLHGAASHGDLDQIRFLLSQGVNPSIQGENRWTPLHYAVATKDKDCAQALLEGGADVLLRGGDGKTPLELATFYAYNEIEEVIRNHIQRIPSSPS